MLSFANYCKKKFQFNEMAQSRLDAGVAEIIIDQDDWDFINAAKQKVKQAYNADITDAIALRSRYTTLLRDQHDQVKKGRVRIFGLKRVPYYVINMTEKEIGLEKLKAKLKRLGLHQVAEIGFNPDDETLQQDSKEYYKAAFSNQDSINALSKEVPAISVNTKSGKTRTQDILGMAQELAAQNNNDTERIVNIDPVIPDTYFQNFYWSKHPDPDHIDEDRDRSMTMLQKSGNSYDWSDVVDAVETTLVGDITQGKKIPQKVWDDFKTHLPSAINGLYAGLRSALEATPYKQELNEFLHLKQMLMQLTAMFAQKPHKSNKKLDFFEKSTPDRVVRTANAVGRNLGMQVIIRKWLGTNRSEHFKDSRAESGGNKLVNKERLLSNVASTQQSVPFEAEQEEDFKTQLLNIIRKVKTRGENSLDDDELMLWNKIKDIEDPEAYLTGMKTPNLEAPDEKTRTSTISVPRATRSVRRKPGNVSFEEWVRLKDQACNEVGGAVGTLGPLKNTADYQVEGDPCSATVKPFNAYCKKRDKKKN